MLARPGPTLPRFRRGAPRGDCACRQRVPTGDAGLEVVGAVRPSALAHAVRGDEADCGRRGAVAGADVDLAVPVQSRHPLACDRAVVARLSGGGRGCLLCVGLAAAVLSLAITAATVWVGFRVADLL